jgi:hypothetical protein
LETFIGRLHKKSLTKKIPTNLDSSSAIEFLAQAVQGSLLKKRKEVVKRKTLTIKLVLKNRKARIVQTKIRVVKKRRS